MMTRVVAIHGSTGAGKSTLCRLMQNHLGTDCLVIQENLEEVLTTSSTDDDQVLWYCRTTAISASDLVTNILMERIGPISVLASAIIVDFLMGTVWPIVLLFVGCLTIGRLYRWFSSHMLSKVWLYSVFNFSHRQKTTNYRWVWRDRTCLDAYAFCLLEKATAVPSNMGSVLLEETNATSVALILDVPPHIVEKHLRTRIYAPTTPRLFAFVTRLVLLTGFIIKKSVAVVRVIERWYAKMNVPVIKNSELLDKLDYDGTTGNIVWSTHSISVLLETIERAIAQRGPPSTVSDESFMPWQIEKNSRLFHV
jgi:energy-coupling factor transporter ATP-binding protein EcfA2